FSRWRQAGQVRDRVVTEDCRESDASVGVGQGDLKHSKAALQQQNAEDALYQPPLDHIPTGTVTIVQITSLFAGKLGDATVAEADFGGASGMSGIQPVKRSEEQCDRNGEPKEASD